MTHRNEGRALLGGHDTGDCGGLDDPALLGDQFAVLEAGPEFVSEVNRGSGDRGSGRAAVAHPFDVSRVHPIEILHVGKENVDVNDVVQVRSD